MNIALGRVATGDKRAPLHPSIDALHGRRHKTNGQRRAIIISATRSLDAQYNQLSRRLDVSGMMMMMLMVVRDSH